MKTDKLKNLCTEIVDCPHETPEWKSNGVPIIRNFNLENGTLNLQNLSYVDEETYIRRTRRIVPEPGDIIFSREAPIGNFATIPEGFKCCLGQRLVLLRPERKKISSEYLAACLASEYIKKQIDVIESSGSIVSNFAIKDLKELQIPILKDQKEIGEFFSNLTNLIFSLNSLSKTLTMFMQLIYSYWFLDFNFPDEKGNPYKASGGKMIWNNELKHEIPEGWIVKKLLDLAHYTTQKHEGKELSSKIYIDTDSMKKDYQGVSKNKSIENNVTATNFRKGDILLSNIRPYFKKIWISDCSGGCSSDVLVIRSNNREERFIYSSLANDRFFAYDVANSKGSKMPRGDKDRIMNYPIVYDPSTVLSYSNLVSKMFDQIALLRNEIDQLKKMRDFLLPLLMNGQFAFKDTGD